MDLPRGDFRKVRTVLEITEKHIREGKIYQGNINHKGGARTIIKEDSLEEKLIAKYKGKGLSFSEVTASINHERIKQGIANPNNPDHRITRSAVVSHYL